MATYLYETTSTRKPMRRFELQQSMKDAPFTEHPETGEPIRRVITGGIGMMVKGAIPPPPPECGRGACPRCID
jgi:predicted nucleic acid-binding Zn ribbon protein